MIIIIILLVIIAIGVLLQSEAGSDFLENIFHIGTSVGSFVLKLIIYVVLPCLLLWGLYTLDEDTFGRILGVFLVGIVFAIISFSWEYISKYFKSEK